jgi:hypothetical protein
MAEWQIRDLTGIPRCKICGAGPQVKDGRIVIEHVYSKHNFETHVRIGEAATAPVRREQDERGSWYGE